MGEYDDERPDWREIDRQRDRSKIFGKQEKGGPSKDKPKDRYKTGKWEKALDKLFMGKRALPSTKRHSIKSTSLTGRIDLWET